MSGRLGSQREKATMKALMKVLRLLVGFALCAAALAQTPTASISGRITDQTGAVIPQASVSLTAPNGKESTTTTDAQGSFHFGSLPPGSYGIAARAKGFAPFSTQGVVLVPGRARTLNVTLQ